MPKPDFDFQTGAVIHYERGNMPPLYTEEQIQEMCSADPEQSPKYATGNKHLTPAQRDMKAQLLRHGHELEDAHKRALNLAAPRDIDRAVPAVGGAYPKMLYKSAGAPVQLRSASSADEEKEMLRAGWKVHPQSSEPKLFYKGTLPKLKIVRSEKEENAALRQGFQKEAIAPAADEEAVLEATAT